MILEIFTFFHVALSLIGIGSGFVVLFGLLTLKRFDGWTSLFLATTVATSVTGFFFPVQHFMPSHGLGILSLIVLGIAIPARNAFRRSGAWRKTYVIAAMAALYFNVFVLIVQLFEKVPALKALAPTQSEPPFQIAQALVLILFIALTAAAVIKFRFAPVTGGMTSRAAK